MTYINYAEAYSRLKKRFPDLTPGEFRVWVWASPRSSKCANYLPAYRRPSPEDYFFSWLDTNNLDALTECWFDAEEIDRFAPLNRYITYQQLLDHWAKCAPDPYPDIATYIENKLRSKRLDFYEFGRFDVLDRTDPPLHECMFNLDQVATCERRWFGISSKPRGRKQKPRLPEKEAIKLLSDPNNYTRQRFLEAGGTPNQFKRHAKKLEKEGQRKPNRPGPKPNVPELFRE